MPASNSRFKFSQLINVDGKETYGRWVPPSFMESKGTTYIVPSALAGRPDLISNVVFRTPRYDWAIIMFNSPRDPLNWPKAGETIRLPDIASILSEL